MFNRNVNFLFIVVIFIFLNSCCKDSEITSPKTDLSFSLYSARSKATVTIHKIENKIKNFILSWNSVYVNREFHNNDSLQSVWTKGVGNSFLYYYKNIKKKDTLIFVNSNTDTSFYIFDQNKLKKVIMYDFNHYNILSYDNSQLEMDLYISNVKIADYTIKFDTISLDDYHAESDYNNQLLPLNLLRYYLEYYKIDFPNFSYKTVSVKSKNTGIIPNAEYTFDNEFDSKKRLNKMNVINLIDSKKNDTLTFTHFD